MSSTRSHDNQLFRAIAIVCTVVLALVILLAARAPETDAARAHIASASKLPKITKVSPLKDVAIGTTLKLNGINFVPGKKKLIVIFKRRGSKRSFTARGTATTTKRGSVVVPDLSSDLVKDNATRQDNTYMLRPITKYGAAKAWTSAGLSPQIDPDQEPVGGTNTGPSGDCDSDGVKNGSDSDDDNDLLSDSVELSIGTDVCRPDTDGDGLSDYYEYTVAFAYNGGPVLPYPALRPYPNPLEGGDASYDFDGDGLSMIEEYSAWQYTGLMSHFYSDANQDSDGDGRLDGAEDEDGDLLPNLVEIHAFTSSVSGSPHPDSPLNWLRPDTDGDGLCDGLDDQDHDGPPTALAVADCSTPVPNNGPAGNPPTSAIDSVPGGDPNPNKIDGDDNKYSNFYEWYISGAGSAYDPCDPSPYPTSPYCSESPFDPLPVPGP